MVFSIHSPNYPYAACRHTRQNDTPRDFHGRSAVDWRLPQIVLVCECASLKSLPVHNERQGVSCSSYDCHRQASSIVSGAFLLHFGQMNLTRLSITFQSISTTPLFPLDFSYSTEYVGPINTPVWEKMEMTKGNVIRLGRLMHKAIKSPPPMTELLSKGDLTGKTQLGHSTKDFTSTP